MTTTLEQRPMIEAAQDIVEVLLPIQQDINIQAQESAKLGLANITPEQFGYEPAVSAEWLTAEKLLDNRVASTDPVISPALLTHALPLSERSAATTYDGRLAASRIIAREDDRLLILTGPCSVHDANEAMKYAASVKQWREEYGADLEIFMRMYTEKPRTTIGWKGLTYDPKLDGSHDINLGLTLTRMLACGVTALGVPTAMERLHGLTPQYLNGTVAYDAIGARNVTDQTAREYGSATSSVIGIKNSIDGSLAEACDAIEAINQPHTYLGMNMSGTPSRIHTTGNNSAHIILRGGKNGPNYFPEDIAQAQQLLTERGLPAALLVDASHGNSNKDYRNQRLVVESLAAQIKAGNLAIRGIMLESNLRQGKQDITAQPHEYGVSVTDACINLDETDALLKLLAASVRERRRHQVAQTD